MFTVEVPLELAEKIVDSLLAGRPTKADQQLAVDFQQYFPAARDREVERAKQEYNLAVETMADRWVPACGGLESVTVINGIRYRYMFNPFRGEHGYLNLDTDILLSWKEQMSLMYGKTG